MAFDSSKFSTIATSGVGCNVHVYRTTDAIAVVTASGYFNATTDMRYTIKQYDLIIMVSAAGASNTLITVTSATGTSPITTASSAV